ncbi:MAG: hypothetical protein JWN77_1903 [Frankiales bacterium]|nr:hypothetical protein [Frankiales bacterium]
MQIGELTRRTAVLWLTPEGTDHAFPLWHLWHDGAAYVVGGGLEQPLPDCRRGVVRVRTKDGPMAWTADVEAVPVGGPRWDEVVPLLHAKRLNAPDGDRQPDRWARESQVLRLVPAGEDPHVPNRTG